MSRYLPIIIIVIFISILSSCTLTVEDQQGEKYKVDIQKVDEKIETPSPINKDVPAIVDKKIETIQLTDDSIRESVPSIYRDYIVWKHNEGGRLGISYSIYCSV